MNWLWMITGAFCIVGGFVYQFAHGDSAAGASYFTAALVCLALAYIVEPSDKEK